MPQCGDAVEQVADPPECGVVEGEGGAEPADGVRVGAARPVGGCCEWR